MLHACVRTFDVTDTVKKIWELNRALVIILSARRQTTTASRWPAATDMWGRAAPCTSDCNQGSRFPLFVFPTTRRRLEHTAFLWHAVSVQR